jgi:hypothetical protein
MKLSFFSLAMKAWGAKLMAQYEIDEGGMRVTDVCNAVFSLRVGRASSILSVSGNSFLISRNSFWVSWKVELGITSKEGHNCEGVFLAVTYSVRPAIKRIPYRVLYCLETSCCRKILLHTEHSHFILSTVNRMSSIF